MPAEPIHQECTSLQQRVLAIETLLDGKTFITGAPVQTEDGYDLGYVQVTLGEDGKLTTSREQTISINHGKTPEFNVTVGPDPENQNNGKIYWLINGKPMLDASGNPVEAPKDGKDAPEPTFHIWDGVLCYTFDQNPDLTDRSKNTWYELQNVIGPQGPEGPQGPSGLSITTDKNGKVTITYDHDANPDTPAQTAELPTYASFMKLYDQVQRIQANIDGISTLVGLITGNKDADGNITGGQEFITDYYPVVDDYGVITGFKFKTVKYVKNAEGNFEVVASGVKTVNGLDGKLIKLIQDENDGKYYWVLLGGTKLPVKGEDGADAAQPQFCIVNGHLWYTLDENPGEVGAEGHKWQDLGSVAALLKEGNTDTNKSLVTITRKTAADGNNEVLAFTFGTGKEAVTIEVPTQGAFEDLIKRVADLETNSTNLHNMISAIDGRVAGLEGWLKGMKFVESYELIKDQSGKLVKGFKVTFVTYEAVVDGNTVTYTKKTEKETVEYTDDGLLSLYYDETAGEWYWVFGQDNMIPVKAFKPIFEIHEGHIYASLKKESDLTDPYDYTKTDEWKDLGAVEPELGDTGQVLVGVTEDTEYVHFTFKDKNGNETTLSLPKKDTFLALQEQVNTANSNITALQTLARNIDERLTTVEGDVTILKGYTHVTGYEPDIDKNQIRGYTITFSDGKSIYLGNGLTPQIGIKQHTDGKFYWTVDGKFIQAETATGTTYVEAVGPKGEDAVTPLLKISDDGYWEISYNNGISFDKLLVAGNPVKARGDKGEQGDSMFADPPIEAVDIDGDRTADKLIITLADGQTKYEFPTWAAFEALKRKVDAINTTVEAFADILNGTKFIQSIEAFEDKNDNGVVIATGYKLTYVEYTANGLSAPKTERIYNGSVVTIGYDSEEQKYYWMVNGDWLYVKTGSGAMVRVPAKGEQGIQGEPGTDAPIPSFTINEQGELIVTVGDKVTNLGDITGETGTDGAVNITWNGKNDDVNPIPAADADYIYIQYGPNATDVIEVPTRKAFNALAERVGSLENNFGALKELVESNTFVQSIEHMTDNATGAVIGFKATIGKYVQTNGSFGMADDYPKTVEYRDDQISIRKDADGNYWWVIKDADGNVLTEVKLTGSDFVPKVEYYNGHLYVSKSPNAGDIEKDLAGSASTDVTKGYWTDLGQITPSNGTDGVTLESVAEGTGEDAGYIVMTFVTGKDASGNKTYQTMKVPTKATFDALVTRVANLEDNVDALETLVAESTFVKNITTKTVKDSNGYEYVNGFDAEMVKYQKVNGVWTEVSDGTYPKKITYTDDKITLVKNAETGAWEWKIKTNNDDGPTTITLPASGGAPRFELFNGRIYVAIDPRANTPETDLANDSTKGYWRDLGLLNPGANVDGGAGNSLLSVDTNDNGTEVTFKFTDGTTIVVPTQSAFEDLNASVAQLNKDVKDLQDIVTAIQEEDYVTRYEELKEDNTVTGIRLHFKKGGSVDIDYGKDGVAPEIGVTYGDDGILYWTIGGQPLYYPGTTNPVPASYPTPIFDVTEDGELKVSYNNGSSWDSLGKVVGEQGDSMFKNVELSEDGMFILVTLSDDVEYKLPIWQDLSITLAQNSLSFTTGQELSVKYTIKGPLSSGMPEVATIAEGDWTATYTIEDKNDSQMSGYIVITAPAEGQRLKSGKVLVFASIHGQTVMRSITTNTNSSFGSEGVVDTDANEFQLQNGQLNLDYKRRDLTLKFTTNTVANQPAYDEDYYLEAIYDDVDNDWIEGVTNGNPLTRAITVTNQITVKTNTGTNTRSATIKVMKRGSSGAVYTFQIRQSGVQNLNANSNYANCFIVSEPGVYKFTAVKGYDNTTGFISGINSRSVLWAKDVDGYDLSLNNIRVYEAEDLGSGVVIFEVGTYVAGNAVIQVSNGSSALWSWHIWFRAKLGNTNSGTMMDWNLGASGATNEGLYYQWGRKDPFYGNQSAVSGGTEANGIANPDIFYGDWNRGSWASTGDVKTIYDPCPKGYKVPSKSVFGSEDTEPSTNYATIAGLRYRYGGYLYPDTESGDALLREESQKGVLWLSDVDGTTPMHLYYERYQSRQPSWNDWDGEHKLFISTNNKDRSGNDISKSQAHGLNVRCVKE